MLLYPLDTSCFHFLSVISTENPYLVPPPSTQVLFCWPVSFSLIMTFNLSEPSSKLLNTKSLFSLCHPVRSHLQQWFRFSPDYEPWSVITSPLKSVPSSLDWIVSSWSQEHSMATQLHSSAHVVFWTGILSPFSSAHSNPTPAHLLA